MKYLALITFILLICYQTEVSSQPCLPEGISFSTQTEIDNFQTNHPNCTEIEGDVTINGDDITNLNGLNVLTSIGEYLLIFSNGALISLTGLDNVTSIGGDLWIHCNDVLTNLSGLDDLESIGGELWIYYNNVLPNLSGLDSLESIGGDLWIYYNDVLTSLSGLDTLDSIAGGLEIADNPALTSLIGLYNVTSIEGYLRIINNASLTSLTGLDNINAGSINHLRICNNNSLATCAVQSICDYLVSPSGSVNIYNNTPGCNNPHEIANACGFTLSCLPYGNYYFNSQTEIDDFQTNYPDCTELEGVIRIYGSGITNLNGLSVVTSIGEDLVIVYNDTLDNLTGLDNVTYIGGSLVIMYNDTLTSLTGLDNVTTIAGYLGIEDNAALTSLTGLENVTYIAGSLRIQNNAALTSLTGLDNMTSIMGDLWIRNNATLTSLSGLDNVTSIGVELRIGYNTALTSLTGLDNVTSIGGYLEIWSNDALTSLTALDNVTSIAGALRIQYNAVLTSLAGLDNINSGSINDLYMIGNSSLSTCEVKSVCDYLASPNGIISIYNNATGCNNQAEVEEACETVTIDEVHLTENLLIYPNPLANSATISYKLMEPGKVTLTIYNYLGQQMETLVNQYQQIGKHQVIWNAEGLTSGIYFFRLQAGQEIATRKILVIH